MTPVQYENREVPETVNLPTEHPLKDFVWMLGAVGLIVATSIVLLILLTDHLIHYVPFELEQRLATSMEVLPKQSEHQAQSTEQKNGTQRHQNLEVQQYLQKLADKLVLAHPLPEDMHITVHYRNDGTVNAFATLGGHIMIHRGLIERLDSENALAMVVAHEIEHIRHRHPIRAAGRHVVIMLALASITGFSESGAIDSLVGALSAVSLLSFSRDQEIEADAHALETLQRHYGHVGGADQLFEVLKAESETDAYMAFMSTHPLSTDRIEAVAQFVQAQPTADFSLKAMPELLNAEQQDSP